MASLAAAQAPITLATRAVVLACLWLVAASVSGVWFVESTSSQLIPSDAIAYPMMVVWFGGLGVLLWQRPGALLLVQRLASLGAGLYFLGSIGYVLFGGQAEPSSYTLATMFQWLMAAHLVLFITWPPRRALLLSASLTTLVAVAGVAKAWHAGGSHWHGILLPLLINACVAQAFLIALLYGIGSQLSRLSVLLPSDKATQSEALTIEGVLALRLQELERARDSAEAANEAKSKFLATMSHELRTPLHGVLGAVELLRGADAYDAHRGEWIQIIQRGGTHLLRLVEDLLDLSRIEAGHLELAQRPFEPRRCMARALESVRPIAEAKGLTLREDVSADVPQWLCGDALRVTQILINLLANALKFTERGEVTLSASHASDGRVLLAVRDTGIGIASADQERVFQSFFQVDTAAASLGTGLGLAITRQLVALMGGEIELESELGRGTCVRLLLPLGVAPAPTEAVSTFPERRTLHGVQILLAEDDPVSALIASQLLTNLFADVHVVDSGLAVLKALSERPGHFDAVLMDWRMPGMDGLEATRRIREGAAGDEALGVPIVGLTANAFEDDRAACLQAGMNDVLAKPVGSDALLHALLRQLVLRVPATPQQAGCATEAIAA